MINNGTVVTSVTQTMCDVGAADGHFACYTLTTVIHSLHTTYPSFYYLGQY